MDAKHATLGTLAWAERQNGRMTLRERAGELARGLRTVAGFVPDELRRRLGRVNPRAFSFDLDRIQVPDSAVAKQAEELAREAQPEWLMHHAMRTWLWAALLGEVDGIRADAELLYVAALLHDLTTTDRFRDYAPMPCFAARGGILARDWARERGWDAARCATLGDAISLHLNVSVPAHHGPEAQLLQAGAALDMIGLRYGDLAPGTVRAVLERHPRQGIKKAGLPLFVAEAHPRTRARLLQRGLGFLVWARHAPFPD